MLGPERTHRPLGAVTVPFRPEAVGSVGAVVGAVVGSVVGAVVGSVVGAGSVGLVASGGVTEPASSFT